jgi:hypothetical protein
MRCRIRRIDKRTRPHHAQRIALLLVPVVLPDTVRVLLDRVLERVIWRRGVQQLQIAHEDALELVGIAAAVGLAALVVDDAVVVGELFDGGFGDLGSEGQVGAVGGGFVELDEAAEDDALVVGPCCLGCC